MSQSPLRHLRHLLIPGLYFAAGLHAEPARPLAATVAELGRLNGIALACQQPALSARLRELLLDIAPREREIGEQFEQATSEAYLASGSADGNCPDGRSLASAIARLENELPAAKRP